MIFQRPKRGSYRWKKGFALFPVTAGDRTIWLESYEVFQSYDRLEGGWYNQFFRRKEAV